MSDTDVAALIHDCMIVTMKLSFPVLGVALVAGLLISFIQAITQINEATLAFLPKIVAIGLALALLGPFMAATLSGFTHRIFDRIVAVGGS
ncbi:MAG: flagellar biosynthesis protein FliQ [Acetobacteraceae bacterium]|jgi:flagellar biosynthetic protein FliQ|nr:flagellar biosynthesis protein FliQ [Acetobacteraceae bacterium]